MMKKCPECRQVKSSADFYSRIGARDGLSYWCKSCTRNYQRKKSHTAEYQKKYREWREKHKNVHRGRKYARSMLCYALQQGKLIRPKSCAICHRDGKVIALHVDYSRPYDVLWVCYRDSKLFGKAYPATPRLPEVPVAGSPKGLSGRPPYR